MRSKEEQFRFDLEFVLREFPDLDASRRDLGKDVLAHFGKLFFSFSLVETSLQNAVALHETFSFARAQGQTDQRQWAATFDREMKIASELTLGRLIAKLRGVDEYKGVIDDVAQLIRKRNYFVHHFMRNESLLLDSREGCLVAIVEMARARWQAKAVDKSCHSCFTAYCSNIGINVSMDEVMGMVEAERVAFRTAKRVEKYSFPWEV